MTGDTRFDAAALDDAARAAAAAGDYESAARHLRDAAAGQERVLGPEHPDLVNTWNNLGVVLERLEQPREAEAAYRRAYAIARRAFDPGHPTVVTSETNLREFCAARGVAFEAPVVPPASPASSAAPSAQPPSRTPAPPSPAPAPAPAPKSPTPVLPPRTATPRPRATPSPSPAPPSPSPAAARDSRRVPGGEPRPHRPTPPGLSRGGPMPGVAIVVALVVLALLVWLMFGGTDEPSSAIQAPANDAAAIDGAAPLSEPAERQSAAQGSAGGAPNKRAATGPSRAGTPPTQPAATRAGSMAQATVARAELCRTLTMRSGAGQWSCQPAGDPVRPGPLVFYTRVRASAPVTIQHRWYQADALQQQVDLAVHPNTAAGYRTYSRRTMEPADAGAWRVEVRSDSGALLHQQRFVVRRD